MEKQTNLRDFFRYTILSVLGTLGVSCYILSLLRGLVLLVSLAFLLSALAGMNGVWLTYPITEFIVALLGLFC